MKDRVPRYPGRVKLTYANGRTEYVTMERADQPTEPGTPYNVASILADSTAKLYGLTAAATANDVFVRMKQALDAERAYVEKTRPKWKTLINQTVTVSRDSLETVTMSGNMQDFDILLFRIYGDVTRNKSSIGNCTLLSSEAETSVSLANLQDDTGAKSAAWSAWFKFPSGYYTKNANTLFSGSSEETAARLQALKFTGNKVYLRSRNLSSAQITVEVVGYNLTGGDQS